MGNISYNLMENDFEIARVSVAQIDPRLSFDCYDFKVILVGTQGCGKTSLCRRINDNIFDPGYALTLACDNFLLYYTVKLKGVTKLAKLNLWDTVGDERYRPITSVFCNNSRAVLLVYDMADLKSWQEVPKWLTDVKDRAAASVLYFLVGAKKDLHEQRAVSLEAVNEFQKGKGFHSAETSAKSGEGIEELFCDVAKCLVAQQENVNFADYEEKRDFVRLVDEPKRRKSGCC
eukprot:TRINITY_DN3482_c0_g1_i3.p1 TRINITY_DN3482_c0_g1~~TRINITY_DN3482_c0_g1_i3.p1  ORF type:complete len:232 (-),score=31.00 TRINITY_DN3482_c0_g1_i3:24-719(-)